MASFKRKLRLFLLRWHRRIGVILSLFVILIAVTGIIINHANRFSLDTMPITSPWILSWYGIEFEGEIRGYPTGAHWISAFQEKLYWDSESVSYCTEPLKGVETTADIWFALCGTSLLLISGEGELIETLSDVVPNDSTALSGVQDDWLIIATGSGQMALHSDSLELKSDLNSQTTARTPTALPADLQAELNFKSHSITVERLLLDLHSGRVLQLPGALFNDLVALVMILLALSGSWLWLQRKR
ncbi:MAG: PepSY domain-containing protein [Candidatus Thiodiazotropha sp. (ex Lucina aurantia)]|nr:PepSY domain-containing protein [Candidatus Thiodiazotropha sp. (ex Lucina pensylvanica)]MBT3024397.1 PepSY domain-containing protein [Candidatus Thiodiazotropha taylori]MBT3051856.1 PepSY domain-containing protein [Candidatus Thiodiazotropha sp. (ex Codakia orbicularis)]MBV2104059.1 PepSY domain-containing protein [Candidatus Thiodiazotropha sp. (ex Lucina aurantia)]MBT3032395.1 PepSY domain-containing protein [Candidatus Thiodiazotropha sp. (ex Lucina pensylvanica)]